jgi:hypothetical protein
MAASSASRVTRRASTRAGRALQVQVKSGPGSGVGSHPPRKPRPILESTIAFLNRRFTAEAKSVP